MQSKLKKLLSFEAYLKGNLTKKNNKNSSSFGSHTDECSICGLSLADGRPLCETTTCLQPHTFHCVCIYGWIDYIESENIKREEYNLRDLPLSCPLCRKSPLELIDVPLRRQPRRLQLNESIPGSDSEPESPPRSSTRRPIAPYLMTPPNAPRRNNRTQQRTSPILSGEVDPFSTPPPRYGSLNLVPSNNEITPEQEAYFDTYGYIPQNLDN